MTIELKPEQERVIEQAIEAGLIRSAEDVVDIGINSVRQQLGHEPAEEPIRDNDAWQKRFEDWAESHPRGTPLLSDDGISRDSIYGNRGI